MKKSWKFKSLETVSAKCGKFELLYFYRDESKKTLNWDLGNKRNSTSSPLDPFVFPDQKR
jgi:hypothetical protein